MLPYMERRRQGCGIPTPYAQREGSALLEDWGRTVRRSRGVPAHYTYRFEGKYSPCTLQRRFDCWSSVPDVFRRFAKGKRKWKDVLALLPASGPPPGPTRVPHARRSKAQTEGANKNSASAASPAEALHAPLKDRPTFGNPTQFRWLRFEPVNEQGVVLLFGMLAKQLGYIIETVQTGFPDCEALRQISPERWQRVLIEFEFESRNFRDHGHPSTGCDLIVCRHHNWQECPEHLEVLELSRVIRSLSTCEAQRGTANLSSRPSCCALAQHEAEGSACRLNNPERALVDSVDHRKKIVL